MEEYFALFKKYAEHTMIHPNTYVRNLRLAEFFQGVEGTIVECGTWRGGMIAGIAELIQSYHAYYLFDSFEGLPEAQEVDGIAAKIWQTDTCSPSYYNNCSADEASAIEAMTMSGVKDYYITKGWFSETLKNFDQPISILRLDGDWYESTMDCLTNLYPKVVDRGLILIDDYHTWDGCSRAVHDYFSKHKICDRIRQYDNDVCFILKGWSNRKS
jgi:O-methyltransferase